MIIIIMLIIIDHDHDLDSLGESDRWLYEWLLKG